MTPKPNSTISAAATRYITEALLLIAAFLIILFFSTTTLVPIPVRITIPRPKLSFSPVQTLLIKIKAESIAYVVWYLLGMVWEVGRRMYGLADRTADGKGKDVRKEHGVEMGERNLENPKKNRRKRKKRQWKREQDKKAGRWMSGKEREGMVLVNTKYEVVVG